MARFKPGDRVRVKCPPSDFHGREVTIKCPWPAYWASRMDDKRSGESWAFVESEYLRLFSDELEPVTPRDEKADEFIRSMRSFAEKNRPPMEVLKELFGEVRGGVA